MRFPAARLDFLCRFPRLALIDVQDMDDGAARRECLRDRAPNPERSAGHDRAFPVQPKAFSVAALEHHSDTPLFHGMKSFCDKSSAFVYTSPLATRTTSPKMSSPTFSIVVSPLTMLPVSISMMSAMRAASCEFVEIFTTGAIGLPVGVPRPVVNNTTLAPAAVCAVTHSTSLPGVHSRFSPGRVANSG